MWSLCFANAQFPLERMNWKYRKALAHGRGTQSANWNKQYAVWPNRSVKYDSRNPTSTMSITPMTSTTKNKTAMLTRLPRACSHSPVNDRYIPVLWGTQLWPLVGPGLCSARSLPSFVFELASSVPSTTKSQYLRKLQGSFCTHGSFGRWSKCGLSTDQLDLFPLCTEAVMCGGGD